MEIFTLTERKRTGGDKALSVLFGVLTILALASFIIIPPIAIILIILFAVLWYYATFRRNYEFEVSYFDGEFRVAKIINKSRRKKVVAASMESVVLIAPQGDRSVYKYENDKAVKFFDCTSLDPEASVHEIIVNEEGSLKLIKVELDERILDEVCKKYQQKVTR